MPERRNMELGRRRSRPSSVSVGGKRHGAFISLYSFKFLDASNDNRQYDDDAQADGGPESYWCPAHAVIMATVGIGAIFTAAGRFAGFHITFSAPWIFGLLIETHHFNLQRLL